MKIFILLGAVVLSILGFSFLFAQNQAGSAGIQAKLIGTWKLVSTEEKLRDGRTRPYPDLGPEASGYLIYTSDGHMCAALMKPGRPQWSHSPDQATDVEKVSAASGYTSYYGKYRVDEKRQIIQHLPEVSLYPNFIGTTQVRPYRLEGNRMTFSAPEESGEVERWTIVWEKVK